MCGDVPRAHSRSLCVSECECVADCISVVCAPGASEADCVWQKKRKRRDREDVKRRMKGRKKKEGEDALCM